MELSIIIPTYNEATNVGHLLSRIQAVLDNKLEYEVWFIDDSSDETPQILAKLSQQFANVFYVHRENARGLGTAIVCGFAKSTGRLIIVMDADLQHPPELLPELVDELRHGAEVVIPSRFIEGGSDGGLNGMRKLISFIARKIGQLAIPRLAPISDCTSGYFGLQRAVIENVPLSPCSWKILIEIIVKGRYQLVKEIPYTFLARNLGESKMSLKEQWNYLRHILRLVRENVV